MGWSSTLGHVSRPLPTRKHLRQAMETYPDAANEIKAWTACGDAPSLDQQ